MSYAKNRISFNKIDKIYGFISIFPKNEKTEILENFNLFFNIIDPEMLQPFYLVLKKKKSFIRSAKLASVAAITSLFAYN